MNAFLCVTVIIIAAIVVYIGIRLDLIAQSIDNVEHNVSMLRNEVPSRNWFSTAKTEIDTRLNSLEDTLTTEIACLATKNNEDIKRMKGDYAVGDILRFGGIRMRVFGKDTLDDGRTRWKLFGENGAEYRIYLDSIPEDIEYLGHRDISFE